MVALVGASCARFVPDTPSAQPTAAPLCAREFSVMARPWSELFKLRKVERIFQELAFLLIVLPLFGIHVSAPA